MTKAEIIRIGSIDENGKPVDWHFDHRNAPDVAAINITTDGAIIYSGYTVEELKQIAEQDKHVN